MVRSAVLVCGLSVAAVGAAFAQDQAPPPPPPQRDRCRDRRLAEARRHDGSGPPG